MTNRERRTTAEVRLSRWPGWIWAVPVVAVAIVGWLAIRHFAHSGPDITITFPEAAGMQSGDTKIKFRGLVVGTVNSITLSKDHSHVVVSAEMKHDVKDLLRKGTRFWLVGTNVSLSNLSTLKTVIAGPYIELDAGSGPAARHFQGLDKPPVHMFHGRGLRYRILFDGAVGTLDIDTPVTLRGFTIGRVTAKELDYDATHDRLTTPVTVELDPAALGIRGHGPGDDPGRDLNKVLKTLIGDGLRAKLGRDPPLIGGLRVSLAFDPGAKQASLDMSGEYPVIPAAPADGLNSLKRSAKGALDSVREMDLPAIAASLRQTVERIDSVVSSSKLQKSLGHLDQSLANVEAMTKATREKVGPALDAVNQAAEAARSAMASANDVLGSGAGETDRALPRALKELASAARSIRVLADYLERHPEALLEGKKKP